MFFNTETSDALLRPDISLLLPLLTATNPTLHLLSTSLLPLKWASGCDCFTSLCFRKRISRIQSSLILLTLLLTHINSYKIPIWLSTTISLVTPESLDTKVLKICMIAAGHIMPLGIPLAASILLGYGILAGYRVRLSDSWDLLLSNDHWLLTRDARLAKRVNGKGDFHVEVLQNGRTRLMGDGRLASGTGVMRVEEFDTANLDVVKKAQRKGRVTVEDGVVSILQK